MNKDICSLIASYIIKDTYELLDWINKSRLHIDLLPLNKNSINYLEKKENYKNINWSKLSGNKNAIHLIIENKNKIN